MPFYSVISTQLFMVDAARVSVLLRSKWNFASNRDFSK